MNILLLGKSGMLGSTFLKLLVGEKDLTVFGFDYDTLDITDPEALKKVFEQVSPQFVINCAAYTAVDDCEKNEELAFKVNGYAAGEIARLSKIHNSILIHFSTDYIFDGQKKEGYKENENSFAPLNKYGESKLIGEELIQKNTDRFYIARTSWLFGPNGKNFVDTMLTLAETKPELDVVDDQVGSPTYTFDLAKAVIKYFIEPYLNPNFEQHEHWLEEDGNVHERQLSFGIYHLTNSNFCSWNEFAKKIFRFSNKDIKVNKVTSDKFPRPAKRPHYSILLNTKMKHLRSWKDALKHYLDLKS
jgi:dTDP-4-dehydrorhamnose reductase